MTYLLLLCTIIILLICYFLFGKDFFNPSMLMGYGYVLSLISLIYNDRKWGANIGEFTFLVILIGMICFILGNFLGSLFRRKNCKYIGEKNFLTFGDTRSPLIFIPKRFVIIEFILGLGIIYLYLQEIYRIALLTPGVETYGITWAFRNAKEEAVNTVIVQLSRFVFAFSYIFLFVIINNFINRKNFPGFLSQNILYFLPVCLTVILSILKGGRLQLILLAVFVFFTYYILWRKKIGWGKKIQFRFIFVVAFSLALFLFCFYAIKELVGRVNDSDFIDYITYYMGGSIKNLDLFLMKGEGDLNNPPFTETFYGLIRTFHKLGFASPSYKTTLPHLNVNGIGTGNVYTNLRRFYNDFGFIGVMLMQFLFGFLFGFLYSKIKSAKKMTVKNVSLLIVYASLLYSVIIQSIEDQFFHLISGGTVIEIFIIMFCVYVTFGIKSKKYTAKKAMKKNPKYP